MQWELFEKNIFILISIKLLSLIENVLCCQNVFKIIGLIVCGAKSFLLFYFIENKICLSQKMFMSECNGNYLKNILFLFHRFEIYRLNKRICVCCCQNVFKIIGLIVCGPKSFSFFYLIKNIFYQSESIFKSDCNADNFEKYFIISKK